MIKPEKAVIDNTKYITGITLCGCVLMHAVFLVAGFWEWRVLWGSLLGAAAAIANFFFMALTVQKAVGKEEKEARDLVRLSQTLRHFALIAVGAVGALVPVFNVLAVLIPLFFPRIAVGVYPLFHRKEGKQR